MAKTSAKRSERVLGQTRWLAALGAAFVLALFAILIRESLSTRPRVPDLDVRIDEILQSSHGYLVSLKIDNAGEGTAAQLVIEGVLMRDGTNLETSVVTVDYIAPESTRDAALFFSNDPRQGKLIVRPKGYIEP